MRNIKITDIILLVLFLTILQNPCSCLQSTIDTNITCTSLFVKPEQNFQKKWSDSYGTQTQELYPDFYTIERLQKIYIRYSKYINGIKFVFTNGIESPYYGYQLGTQYEWTVPDCQNIIQINIRSGGWMDALQFITDKGTTSPMIGGTGGNGPYKFSWNVNGGIHGVRVSNIYNAYVGSIQFYVQKNWI